MENLTEHEKTILDMADKIRKEKLESSNYQDTSMLHAETSVQTKEADPQTASSQSPKNIGDYHSKVQAQAENSRPNQVRLQPHERAEKRFCQRCNDSVMHVERKTSHILHAIFSVITAGVWLIGWLAVHFYNQSKGSRCIRCGTVQKT